MEKESADVISKLRNEIGFLPPGEAKGAASLILEKLSEVVEDRDRVGGLLASARAEIDRIKKWNTQWKHAAKWWRVDSIRMSENEGWSEPNRKTDTWDHKKR